MQKRLMKTMHLFFTCVLIANPSLLNAQAFQWAKGFGNNADEIGSAIAVDANDNVYSCGEFWSTVDFDPGPAISNMTSAGNRDIYISKMDPEGNFMWSKRMGGIGSDLPNAMAIDANGYIYTTGQYIGTADFDPGPGVFNLTPVGNVDIFISKLDPNGNFVWAKRIGSTANDFSYGIAVDGSGNVCISGNLTGTFDFDPGAGVYNLTSEGGNDVFILKLDVNGDFAWAKSIGGIASDDGGPITMDQAGNVYTTGAYADFVDFDPGAGVMYMNSAGSIDAFLCKLDPLGEFVWAKSMGGTQPDAGKGIELDVNGNILITGTYTGTADFNPDIPVLNLTSSGAIDCFIAKYNSTGDLVWAKSVGGSIGNEFPKSIKTDIEENVYVAGYFGAVTDFDPGAGNYDLTPDGFDGFIFVLDPNGSFLNAQKFGSAGTEYVMAMDVDSEMKTYMTGFFTAAINFSPPSYLQNLVPTGGYDAFVVKYLSNGVHGTIYNDISNNCIKEGSEPGLSGRLALINPGSFVVQTDNSGSWYIDSLPAGNFTITFDTSGNWSATCPVTQNFTVTDPNALTTAPNFGMISTQPCAEPDVSITAPSIRRCFANQKIYVRARNIIYSTGALSNAYVEVELDTLFTPTSSSMPYINLGGHRYRVNIGTLNPGQHKDFWIATTLSCDAVPNQTLCMEADLYPADTCALDTIPAPAPSDFIPCSLPWDRSSIHVDGWCDNNTVYFAITNTGTPGNGDMDCYSPMRLYIDGQYIWLDSIQLAGGVTDTLSFSGDGRTWRLEVDQHPLHPGNSHPNASVELCGNIANWTPDRVNILPQDDADPIVDIYCALVTGSYDPNDKTGYPLGVGTTHAILPNGQMEYRIRFQNTGNDTAFTVVIQDTLDMDFDIFSVVSGASSHNYSFRMFGPRVLEWTFNNIMLPDSTADEPGSHGFITFTVNQNEDLPPGTEMKNTAYIYFDFNAAVVTNTTSHVIDEDLQQASWTSENNMNAVGCGSFSYGGIIYDQSGTYWQVKDGAIADTLLTLNIVVKDNSYSNLIVNACDSYTAADGVVHTTSGIKTATVPNSIGCDSIITIILTLNYTSLIDTSITQSGTVLTSNSTGGTWTWMDCNSNTVVGTGQSYNVTANGSYAVVVSQNNCINTSSCYVFSSVGLEDDLAEGKVAVSPNPGTGIFKVSLSETYGQIDLCVSNALGQIVLKQEFKNVSELHFDLEKEEDGIYFMRINAGERNTFIRIIKQ